MKGLERVANEVRERAERDVERVREEMVRERREREGLLERLTRDIADLSRRVAVLERAAVPRQTPDPEHPTNGGGQ